MHSLVNTSLPTIHFTFSANWGSFFRGQKQLNLFLNSWWRSQVVWVNMYLVWFLIFFFGGVGALGEGWCSVHIGRSKFYCYALSSRNLIRICLIFMTLAIGLSPLQILICIMLIAPGTLKNATFVVTWFQNNVLKITIWTHMHRYGKLCLVFFVFCYVFSSPI